MKTRSFTLIELLIVLVIIGVVAVLAIPGLEIFVINSHGVEAMNNLRALADSAWRYYQETGHFPTGFGSPIPSVLDVKINSPSKYYNYIYFCDDASKDCHFAALDINANNFPEGAITGYTIGLLKASEPNPYYEGEYEYIGQGFYRYYQHGISAGPGIAPYGEHGWPGGK